MWRTGEVPLKKASGGLSKRELRDLVEFQASLKEPGPG